MPPAVVGHARLCVAKLNLTDPGQGFKRAEEADYERLK